MNERIKMARKVFIGRRRRKEAFSASSAAQNGFLKGRATKLVANYDIPTLYVARVATPCRVLIPSVFFVEQKIVSSSTMTR